MNRNDVILLILIINNSLLVCVSKTLWAELIMARFVFFTCLSTGELSHGNVQFMAMEIDMVTFGKMNHA